VRAACCSHVEGMNEHSLPTEDEAAFEAYLDILAAALHHRSRKQPLRDSCTGLLLPEGRKSMEPMAARLAPARTRTMHKTLLNFVSEGAWSDEAVLAAMRPQVLPAMQAHGPLRFWIVDESGMPKKGKHSVGVARQYCGEVGKVDNCQVLVSLSVANEAACLPLAARLYLPEAWAVDEKRRSKVGVPLDVVFQSKPALALEQIRAAHAAGVPPGVVLADAVYGSTASFRQGVSALGLDYAAAVRATTPAAGQAARPGGTRRCRCGRCVPRSAWRTWREGSGPELSGRFAAIRGRDGAEGEQTLLLEWGPPIRLAIGWSPWRAIRPSTTSSPRPKAAGGSNKITENSSKKLASATSRGGVGGASITTSR
jgi:SRSO17 transposase